MYRYKVQIKKVSGMLKESVLPKKSLLIKSKCAKTNGELMTEAADYLRKKYNLELKSAKMILEKAPRLDSTNDAEVDAARTAQSNHHLSRPKVSIKQLRDKLATKFAEEVYSKFRDGRRRLRHSIPYGVVITLDGDVEFYGDGDSGWQNYTDAAKSTWNQSWEADEKAADNVFSYAFSDDDSELRQLVWYLEDLDNEISYSDDVDEDTDTSWMYYDELDNVENALDSIKSYDDIKTAAQNVSYKTSVNLIEEIKINIDNIIKNYMKMGTRDGHSRMGLKKMQGEI